MFYDYSPILNDSNPTISQFFDIAISIIDTKW